MDLTYHCEDCKRRNELADKLDTNPKWLREHPTHHAIQTEEQGQLFDPDLFNDRRTKGEPGLTAV